jgi:glyoxylase-like metal-dependent hydrolase (beta-lactamase superfamily II)
MRIHAIQTGEVAVKASQADGGGRRRRSFARLFADRRWTDRLPILAWLIEHPEGLIVVDTGETARTAEPGYFTPWQPYFRLGLREWVRPDEEIGPQLRRLGFAPADVRWIVITHFHTDHAGGLAHFPHNEIVTSRGAFEEARGLVGKARGFLPQHWPDGFAPTLVDFASGPFGPFPASARLTRAGDVHLVPTLGHTGGHLSVAVEDDDELIFLAGDASYTQALMLAGRSDGVAPKPSQSVETLTRIQRLVAERPTVYLPTHDPRSAARLAARETAAPAAGEVTR